MSQKIKIKYFVFYEERRRQKGTSWRRSVDRFELVYQKLLEERKENLQYANQQKAQEHYL